MRCAVSSGSGMNERTKCVILVSERHQRTFVLRLPSIVSVHSQRISTRDGPANFYIRLARFHTFTGVLRPVSGQSFLGEISEHSEEHQLTLPVVAGRSQL
jgi:hypothetical protein